MASKRLQIILEGDAKGAIGAFGDVGGAAEGLGSKFGKVGAVGGAAFAGIALAVGGAGAALYGLGDTFDGVFDNLTVKTGATGEQLEGLKDDFKAVVSTTPADFKEAGDAIAILNRQLGLTGEPLQGLSRQLLELSRITETDVNANTKAAADLLNNWQVSADQAGGVMDDLFVVTQKTGIPFEQLTTTLTGSGVVLRDLGFNLGESAALLGTLAKNGIDAGDVMPGFSKALATAAKNGIDAHTALGQTFTAIRNAPNDTAAAQAAMELFGAKAGPKMAGLIREGKLSYDELLASLGATDNITKTADETADLGEKFTTFKNRFMVALEPVASQLFDAFGKGFEAIAPYLDEAGKWLGENLPHAIEWLTAKWAEWGPSFQAGLQAIADTAGPIIAGVVSGFQTVAGWFQSNGSEEGEGVGGNMAKIRSMLSKLGDAFNSVGAFIADVAGYIQTAWENHGQQIVDFLSSTFGYLVDFLGGIFDAIKGIFDTFAALFRGDWEGVWNGIKEFFGGIWDAVVGILNAAANLLLAAITGIGAVLEPIWQNIWGGITRVAGAAWDWIVDKANGVVSFFTGLPGRIGEALGNLWGGLTETWKNVVNFMIDTWNRLDFGIHIRVPDWVPGLGGRGFDVDDIIPDIPKLASGGIVPATPGGRLALLGEGGRDEAVVPLPADLGGTTLQVNFTGIVTDERAVGRELARVLEEFVRGGGRLRIANGVVA